MKQVAGYIVAGIVLVAAVWLGPFAYCKLMEAGTECVVFRCPADHGGMPDSEFSHPSPGIWNDTNLVTTNPVSDQYNYMGDAVMATFTRNHSVIFNVSNQPVITINLTNGVITFAEGYTMPEAASNFWIVAEQVWEIMQGKNKIR